MRTLKALGLVLLIVALGALPVMAASGSVTGSAKYNQPLVLSFTTDGEAFTASATWTPKGKTRYNLDVMRLEDPNDPFSYVQWCSIYHDAAGNPVVFRSEASTVADSTLGAYSCTFTDGEAGYWVARFRPISGNTNATIIVTSP